MQNVGLNNVENVLKTFTILYMIVKYVYNYVLKNLNLSKSACLPDIYQAVTSHHTPVRQAECRHGSLDKVVTNDCYHIYTSIEIHFSFVQT